jgi:DNA replication protein DnaC
MKNIQQIKDYADLLKLSQLKKAPEDILCTAQADKPGYGEFVLQLLRTEVNYRKKTDMDKRLKQAKLPKTCDLSQYDYSVTNGILKMELEGLRELLWIEQNFNVMLMGPSGTGKTFIAAGLVNDAIRNGYTAYFITMAELSTVLTVMDVSKNAEGTYNRLLKADLIAIDDVMMFPINKQAAIAFFNMINKLHEHTSFIITSNKSPTQWAEVLEDPALTGALMDRLLFKSQTFLLHGSSYRMDHRQSIFPDQRQASATVRDTN